MLGSDKSLLGNKPQLLVRIYDQIQRAEAANTRGPPTLKPAMLPIRSSTSERRPQSRAGYNQSAMNLEQSATTDTASA